MNEEGSAQGHSSSAESDWSRTLVFRHGPEKSRILGHFLGKWHLPVTLGGRENYSTVKPKSGIYQLGRPQKTKQSKGGIGSVRVW